MKTKLGKVLNKQEKCIVFVSISGRQTLSQIKPQCQVFSYINIELGTVKFQVVHTLVRFCLTGFGYFRHLKGKRQKGTFEVHLIHCCEMHLFYRYYLQITNYIFEVSKLFDQFQNLLHLSFPSIGIGHLMWFCKKNCVSSK